MASDRARVLIVGLGNILCRDDGVGVHAVRVLQADPPAGATTIEIGTAVLDALPWLEAADVVIALDAVQAGDAPGTIYEVELAAAPARAPVSLHDFNVIAALRLLPPDRRPTVVVLGVEPASVEPGLELTAEIKRALPALIATVRQRVADAIQIAAPH